MPTVSDRRAEADKRRSYHYLADVLRDLELDLRRGLKYSPQIPQDWHAIAQEAPIIAKRKIGNRHADHNIFQRACTARQFKNVDRERRRHKKKI